MRTGGLHSRDCTAVFSDGLFSIDRPLDQGERRDGTSEAILEERHTIELSVEEGSRMTSHR